MNRVLAVLLAAALALACGGRSRTAVAPPPSPPPAPPAAPAVDVQALQADARGLRAAGDLDGARAKLEQALAAAPSDALRLDLADLLVADGRDLDQAAALVADVRDREADVRYDLLSARLAELRGDDAAAADAYARAVARAEDADVRLRRASALERLGRTAEAASELERVRALRPDDAYVQERLAAAYEAGGRIADAEAAWIAAAVAAPERAAGYERLARFYERIGRKDAAERADARARAITRQGERALRPLQPSRR